MNKARVAAVLLGVSAVPVAYAVSVGASPDEQEELRQAWSGYVSHWISEDGRILDRAEGDRSTSEGQSYAMVRALWADDRATFDRVRRWTVQNLQAGDPARLPAWSWGRRDDGSWGILDASPASDADQWIAWALLGAHRRWGDTTAQQDALALLASLWEQETAEVGGVRLMLPGPWAKGADPVQLNPSYWLPFAWRDFAAADPEHDWASLIGPAYVLFGTCVGGSGLPTDWCYVRAADRAVVVAPRGREAHDDFGFEALRVPWTLAAEVLWHREPRAARLLNVYAPMARRYLRDGSLPAVYASDGRARVAWDYVGLYGALLPAWELHVPRAADAAWEALGERRGAHGWGEPTDYYGQNWVWMGQALRVGLARPVTP